MKIEQLWEEAVNLAEKSESITTLKEKATAKVVEVNPNSIKLMLTKGKSIELEKKHFEKALEVLNEKGRVRQHFVKNPKVERYVLGLMMMLPAFRKEEQFEAETCEYKKFIVYK
ncbi:hypothetical protein [Litchfieldia alkalitelluris]|uniref:hypothetical protein n=1 Tax=Litchfieldia alkalitelluris TaxID=304268 RepID=UPI00099844FB|nr:hypothetical protein [Litchfieldia alkalitelluris]